MAVSTLSIATQAQRLADYLPSGRLFQAGNMPGSNLRKLLTGLAHELFTADGYLVDYQNDISPSVTTYFIEEWESALGIPDACFLGEGSLVERRRDITLKLASLGIQTAQDYVDVAAIFGLTVIITSGVPHALFPMTFPILLLTVKEARFTIVVKFATNPASKFSVTFPFSFGDAIITILECLFRRLRPANCDVLFIQV